MPEAAAANPAAPFALTASVHLAAAHGLPMDRLYREISSAPDGAYQR